MKTLKNETYNIERKFINPDDISYNLQCCICNDVFNNPTRLGCGHTYCYNCIKEWMDKSKICPTCRDTINKSEISRDLLAFNIIEEQPVCCNNNIKGCPWKGLLSELLSHLKFCDENINFLYNKKSLLMTLKKKDVCKEPASEKINKNSLKFVNIILDNHYELPGVLSQETINNMKDYISRSSKKHD